MVPLVVNSSGQIPLGRIALDRVMPADEIDRAEQAARPLRVALRQRDLDNIELRQGNHQYAAIVLNLRHTCRISSALVDAGAAPLLLELSPLSPRARGVINARPSIDVTISFGVDMPRFKRHGRYGPEKIGRSRSSTGAPPDSDGRQSDEPG
jgi:hypothetical protein